MLYFLDYSSYDRLVEYFFAEQIFFTKRRETLAGIYVCVESHPGRLTIGLLSYQWAPIAVGPCYFV